MRILLTLLVLVSSVGGVFIKWYEYTLTGSASESKIMFLSDGTGYYTRVSTGDIYYYTFNETGSHHQATLSVFSAVPHFSSSDDGIKLVVGRLTDLYVYEKVGLTFNQLLHYTCSNDIYRLIISNDGSYAYIGYKTGEIVILDIGTLTVIQTLPSISAGACKTISPNYDGTLLAVSYYLAKIQMYELVGGQYSQYGGVYSIPGTPRPKSINMPARNFTLFFLGTLQFEIYIIERSGQTLTLLDVFPGALGHIDSYDIDDEAKYFLCEQNLTQVHMYNIDENMSFVSNSLFTGQINQKDIIIDKSGKFLITVSLLGTTVYLNCGDNCLNCTYNECLICDTGLELDQGVCVVPCTGSCGNDSSNSSTPTPSPTSVITPCVNNVRKRSGVCKEYCAEQCSTCTNTSTNCTKCSKHYVMDENTGTCVIENYFLQLAVYVRPYLNVCRRNWFAPFFLVLEEIWLYNYHSYAYKGRIDDIFSTIRLIEDKKWSIQPFHNILLAKQYIHQQLPRLDEFSNPTFLQKQQHDEAFIKVTVQYFVYYLPLMLVIVFLLNRLFYLLFNYSISTFLRIYSFWGVLWMLAFEGNIQIFIFALLRSIVLGCSEDFRAKMIFIGSVVFGFFLLIYTVVIYYVYKYLYRNLSKYFLNNIYRFQASYVYMTLIYGIRPFLRGTVHALLYYERDLQLGVLGGIEIMTVLVIVIFQFVYEVHACKIGMFWKFCYHVTFILLNFYLICQTHFQLEYIQNILDKFVYLMISFCLLDTFTLFVAGWYASCCCSQKQQIIEEKKTKKSEKAIVKENQNQFFLEQITSPQKVIKPILVIQLKKDNVKINVKELIPLETIKQEQKLQTFRSKKKQSRKIQSTTKKI